jgi:hypothetical protein
MGKPFKFHQIYVSRKIRIEPSSYFFSYNLTAQKEPWAVVSADFTLGYFYKILNDTVPGNACSRPAARCFLLDDRGYLLAHPGLNTGLHRGNNNGHRQDGGRLHLTHLEPFVATDLLAHSRGAFISKRVCGAPDSGHLQRYWELIVNYADVVTNAGRAGESSCGLQYHLAAVQGTNIFLGLVEQPDCNQGNMTTTAAGSAFCWCSTLDRTCLDCQHWEQGECECPCECESRDEFCVAAGDNADVAGGDVQKNIPPCRDGGKLFSESRPSPPRFLTSRTDHLPPCIHTDCAGRTSEADCFGVLGCAWCTTEQDGVSALTRPFCSYQTECFSGVLASPSPYARAIDQSLSLADSMDERTAFRSDS